MAISIGFQQQRSSVLEPLVDQILERITEFPELTISHLIEEITNLLSQSVISEHQEAKSLLEGRLSQISYRKGFEPFGIQEQEFYNFSQILIDRQGKISEYCLARLKTINLGNTIENNEDYETYQLKLKEKIDFKNLKVFINTYEYQKAANCILKMESLLNLEKFFKENFSNKEIRKVAHAIVKQNKEKGSKIIKCHFPPFENPVPKIAFGKAEWEKYFGVDIGEEPQLPFWIRNVLKSPCPFWPDRTVKETHLLFLIPKEFNGKPFTLNTLNCLIQSPKKGYSTRYRHYCDHVVREVGDKAFDKPYWVLMTKDVIFNSKGKTFEEQDQMVANHMPYEVPFALEAATCMSIHYVKTGELLYTKDRSTLTRCQEKVYRNELPVAIGDFSSEGIVVDYYSLRCASRVTRGVAAVLRL